MNDPRALVDDLLEITVVGSFSSPGYAIRRRLFGWEDPAPGALHERTVAITGPTSGLGRATAFALARLGARVLLLGRSEIRLRMLADELAADVGGGADGRFVPVVVDMASLGSVAQAVERIRASEPRIDILVDNAGAIHPRRMESPDGIESTLAVMVVGPFRLVTGLLPLLRASCDAQTGAAGRVIFVTSGGMYTQAVRLDDLQWSAERFSGPRAYARAKRIQVALMREWARRTAGSGLSFVAMHPGWADTPGLAEQLPAFYRSMRPVLRTAEAAVDTTVWLATTPDARGLAGRLFLDRRPRPFDRTPATRLSLAERRRLWQAVVDLAGVPDPAAD